MPHQRRLPKGNDDELAGRCIDTTARAAYYQVCESLADEECTLLDEPVVDDHVSLEMPLHLRFGASGDQVSDAEPGAGAVYLF